MTLTRVFITARILVSPISCGTTFSIFWLFIPFIMHVSSELRENFEIALN